MATVETAIDREALATLVPSEPRALGAPLRHRPARGVSRPADRASSPDRVLRGPSTSVQPQHAPEARRSASRVWTSASSVCSRAASIRTARHPPAAASLPNGRRVKRSGASPTNVTRGFWKRSPARRSTSPAIRCCTTRRPCTRSSSTRRCTRKRCSTCGISSRTSRSGHRPTCMTTSAERHLPARGWWCRPVAPRSAHVRARSRSGGTTSSRGSPSTCPRSRSTSTT